MTTPTGLVTDFDFRFGDWHVENRRLRQRWVGCDDWDVFDGTGRCEPRLGGVANVDDMDCPTRGFSGLTVRVFDPAARQWAIYWASSTAGRLEPPVRGGFNGTIGIFEGPDLDGDSPIDVRFTWTIVDDDHNRWQQAFRRDDHDWEVNWIMDFTRR
jgi:hypothetical protein